MPTPPALTVSLATNLRRSVMRLARRMRIERPSDAMTSPRLSLLGCLRRQGAMTAGELAVADSLQPQSVTRLLAALQREGLITREVDGNDRRKAKLAITNKGMAALRSDARLRDEWLSSALDTMLNAEERRLLEKTSSLLDRLAES